MNEYTFTKVGPMGERDEQYGQTYWGQPEGVGYPVMFNMMTSESIGAGTKISFEEAVVKTSKKGTEYRRLKKVKVVGGAVNETGLALKVAQLEQRVQKLEGGEPTPVADVVLTDEEEKADLSDIPF